MSKSGNPFAKFAAKDGDKKKKGPMANALANFKKKGAFRGKKKRG
jgi:hypothetical protein